MSEQLKPWAFAENDGPDEWIFHVNNDENEWLEDQSAWIAQGKIVPLYHRPTEQAGDVAGVREAVERWLTRWLVVFANRVQYVTLSTRAIRLRETVTEAQVELEAILALTPQTPDVLGETDKPAFRTVKAGENGCPDCGFVFGQPHAPDCPALSFNASRATPSLDVLGGEGEG